MHDYRAMIATNRFGLGARPGEAVDAASDPRGWLVAQVEHPGSHPFPEKNLKSAQQALSDFFDYRSKRRKVQEETRGDEAEIREALKGLPGPRETVAAEIAARTGFAINTDAPFRERLVRFWSNHFTVSMTNNVVAPVAGAFEREAIRPNITGGFHRLLVAAETHSAMLLYLDNAQSVGPNSRAGRRRDRGLNENLAREILELHTVGVDGGYGQADVTSLAKILTGWTVSGPRQPGPKGKVRFDGRLHEPGTHTVMGRRYVQADGDQLMHLLRDLASLPQTARFVATKLARHFIADQPPASAVGKLEKVFLRTDGDLGAVSNELIGMDEAWEKPAGKFKTPDEFQISAYRAMGTRAVPHRGLRAAYASLGQAPFRAPSPAGWPDESKAWLGPDAVMKRLEWSQALAERVGRGIDPRRLLDDALGEMAGETTRKMVRGADSRQQGLVLALMAPEFQRR